MTILEFLKEITEKLKLADISTPELESEIILSNSLEIERYKIIACSDKELSDNEIGLINSNVSRRLSGEPVAYIFNKKEFYSLEFTVNNDVLIPRPETELLVDLAIFYSKEGGSVLDLGTGSGAIAVSLKYNRPDLKVTASDISGKALKIARLNCERIIGDSSIDFIHGDLFEPVRGKKFDIIVSNPPYINPEEKKTLQKEVLMEPEIALFSGEKGRETTRKIILQSGEMLKSDGVLIIEINSGTKDFIQETGESNNYSVSILNDFSNLPRVAVLRCKE